MGNSVRLTTLVKTELSMGKFFKSFVIFKRSYYMSLYRFWVKDKFYFRYYNCKIVVSPKVTYTNLLFTPDFYTLHISLLDISMSLKKGKVKEINVWVESHFKIYQFDLLPYKIGTTYDYTNKSSRCLVIDKVPLYLYLKDSHS